MQFKDIFVAWFIVVFMFCIMFGNMIAVDVNKMKNPKGKDKCDPGSMFFADDGALLSVMERGDDAGYESNT